MSRTMIVLAALAVTATAQPAPAYILDDFQRSWAEVAYYDDPEAVGASFFVGVEGDDYYANVPPENVTGKGGGDVCITLQRNDLSMGLAACDDSPEFELDALNTAHAAGSFSVDFRDPDGATITEQLSYDVAFTGDGTVFPGARAHTGPEPSVGGGVTLERYASVVGSISSPTLGTFVLTGRDGSLGQQRDETRHPLAEWDG